MVKKYLLFAVGLLCMGMASAQITSFPYSEGFETGLNGWTTIDYDYDDANWRVVDMWNMYEIEPRTGDSLVMSFGWDEENVYAPDNFLVSPQIVVPSDRNVVFTFWVKRACPSDFWIDEYIDVSASTGSTASDFLTTMPLNTTVIGGNFDIYNNPWQQVSVSLSPYQGQTIRLALRHYNSEYLCAVAVDDIELKVEGGSEVSLPTWQMTAEIGRPLPIQAHYAGQTTGLSFTWSSTMQAAGGATMTPNDSTLTITYNTLGIDTLIVTANNPMGDASDTMTVWVIDTVPVSVFTYTNGFETGEDTNWMRIGTKNTWYIGSAAAAGASSRGLYVSSTRGTTNSYDDTESGSSYACRRLSLTAGSYVVSFDYRSDGNVDDYLRAWIAPISTFPVANTLPAGFNNAYDVSPLGWMPIGGALFNQETWTTVSTDIVVPADRDYMLVFLWYNNGSDCCDVLPAAVDNISIVQVPCYGVTNLDLESLSAHDGELTWLDVENASATYTIYNMADTSVVATGITGSSYQLTSLAANTDYTIGVAANCSAVQSSVIHTIDFLTLCDGITTLPWTENFNSFTSTMYLCDLDCWRMTEYNPYWTGVSNTANHGDAPSGKSLRVQGTIDYPTYIALPPVATPTANLMVRFWMTAADTSAYLEWGYMTHPDSPGSFVPFMSTKATAANTWEEHLVRYNNTAYGFIAFRYKGNTAAVIHVDDVTVELHPVCDAPTAMTVQNISATQAYLHITDTMNPVQVNEYAVVVYDANTGDTVLNSVVTDTVIAMNGLTPNSHYNVQMTATCSIDILVQPESYTASFWTECSVPVLTDDLPWIDGFEKYDVNENHENPEMPCWTFIGHEYIYEPYIFKINVDTSFVYAGQKSLQFHPTGYGTTEHNPDFAILPPFEEEIRNLKLDFWMKNELNFANNSCLEVGYLTNVADTHSFVVTATYCKGQLPYYLWVMEHGEVAFVNAPNGSRIAFRYTAPNNICYWYIDDVRVSLLPNCVPPVASVLSVDSSSFTVQILDTAESYNEFDVVVYDDNMTVVDSVLWTSTMGDYTLDSLMSGSDYTLYIKTLCLGGASDSVILHIQTLCQKMPSPYTTGFEDDEIMGQPHCWKHLSADTYQQSSFTQDGGGVVDAWGGHSGPKCLSFQGSVSNVYALPATTHELNDVMLSFWHRPLRQNDSIEGTFQVGYLTNPDDKTTFVPVATYAPPAQSSTSFEDGVFQYEEVTFPMVPAGSVAAMRHNSTYGLGSIWFVDDVTLMHPYCLRPQGMTVYYVDDTSARVHVADTNQPAGFYYELTLNGNVIDSGLVDTDTILLTGLTPGYRYRITVSAACDNGNRSSSLSQYFSATCSPIAHAALPWTEGFETYTTDAALTSVASCWSVINGYPPSPKIDVPTQRSGIKSLYVNTRNTVNQRPTTLVLPLFEDAPADLRLTFWAKAFNAGTGLEIGLIGNPQDESTFEPDTAIMFEQVGSWQFFNQTFHPSTNRHFAIRYTGADNGVFYIDDIMVDSNSLCMRPSAIVVDNIQPTLADVHIFADSVNSFKLYYTAYGDNYTDTVIVADTNGVILTGLIPNTQYTITAQSICSDQSLSGAFTTTFRTDCPPIAELPWTDDFTTPDGGGMNHHLSCWDILYGNATNNGWSANSTLIYPIDGILSLYAEVNLDFVGNTGSIAILPDFDIQMSNVTVSADINWWESGNHPQWLEVGLITDIADGGTFTPIDTFRYEPVAGYIRDTVTVGNYNPEDGRLALRYRIQYNNAWLRVYVDNVTVDGTIVPVVNDDRCSKPIVTDTIVTEDTIGIAWTGSAGSYELYMATSWPAGGPDSVITVTDNEYTWTSLEPSTTYYVGVRSVCTPYLRSTWRILTLTTDEHPCYLPTEVSVTETGFSSARVTWQAGEDIQNHWSVKVAMGNVEYFYDAYDSTVYNVTGLYPGVEYSVQVQAVCNDTSSSEWTEPVLFQTVPCAIPSLVMIEDIHNTMAHIIWPSTGAEKYELRYGVDIITTTGTSVIVEGDTSIYLTSLTANTTYDLYIRSICEEGVESEWSVKMQFTTTNVGIESVKATSTTVRPNPAHELIVVGTEEVPSVMTLYDVQGRKMLEVKANSESEKIFVGDLPRGVYMLRVANAGGTTLHKVILE